MKKLVSIMHHTNPNSACQKPIDGILDGTVARHGHESLNTLAITTRPSRDDLARAVNGVWK